jgi:N utilization substance protein B
MNALFTFSFNPDDINPDIADIIRHIGLLDKQIAASAPEWPVDKIAKIDLAILRLAVYELTIANLEPPKVVIDEAIELAKEFGNDNSSKFVNGVLGTVLKTTA